MANGPAIAAYIAAAPERALPSDVADMARFCLADWLGVAIGAAEEPAGRIVREVAAGWHSEGPSTVLFGGFVRRLQTGFVRSYAASMLLGLVVLVVVVLVIQN